MKYGALILLSIVSFAASAEESTLWMKAKSLLPNSVALDLASNQTTVYLEDRDPLTTEMRPISEGSGDVSRLINAISISSTPSRAEPDGFHFKGTPIFTFAFNNLRFKSDAAFLNETDFQMFRTSLGFGPEVSYKKSWGTLYVSLVPGWSYSWVSWSSPASGGSMGRSNTNLAFSYGYFNYLNDNWAFRVFARQVLEDKNVWNEALDSSQGFDVPVESVSNMVVGLSTAYVF